MTPDDVEAAQAVHDASALASWPAPSEPLPERTTRWHDMLHRFVADDGPGCWLAERDGQAVGMAVAIRRGDLWGLSLLFVHPDHQSSGVGRVLMDRALTYAEDAPYGMIMSSSDPRALRRYALAGFHLHPALSATGVPDRSGLPATLPGREGTEADLELVEAVDLGLRPGPARTADAGYLLSLGFRLQVIADSERRGFALHREARGPVMLGATDTDTARALLLRTIAEHSDGQEWACSGMTSAQNWAVRPLLDARLKLVTDGAMLTRGFDPYPAAYLPSGIYF